MKSVHPRLNFIKLVLLCTVLSLGSGFGEAQARRVYRGYYPNEKNGPFMMNFRVGPAFGIANGENLRYIGAAGVDLGFAVSSNYNAYIVLTPNVQFRDNYANIQVPIGFQYDIRLARGLYLYPRVSIGYAAQIYTAQFDYGPFRYYNSDVVHGAIVIPEFGLKYVVNGALNLGFEPFSLPVFVNGDGYNIWYRFMFFIGFNA